MLLLLRSYCMEKVANPVATLKELLKSEQTMDPMVNNLFRLTGVMDAVLGALDMISTCACNDRPVVGRDVLLQASAVLLFVAFRNSW
jgi:hypothetical protein